MVVRSADGLLHTADVNVGSLILHIRAHCCAENIQLALDVPVDAPPTCFACITAEREEPVASEPPNPAELAALYASFAPRHVRRDMLRAAGMTDADIDAAHEEMKKEKP